MQIIIGSILAIIFLTACASDSAPAPTSSPNPAAPSAAAATPGEIALTAADNGKTISLAINQVIRINLDSNATTGFKWNLTTEPDARILKLVSSEYIAPGNPIPGRGGAEDWKFQAVGAGSTTLKLGYFRPFDPKNVVSEFALTVNVK